MVTQGSEGLTRLQLALFKQREMYLKEGFPSLDTRLDRLQRLKAMVLENKDLILEAEQQDFRDKSPVLIRAAEILGIKQAVDFTMQNVEAWMQPKPYDLGAPLSDVGARAEVQYQPLGVVGVIAPWNGPILLSCLPAMGAMAAGNRVMVKPSEDAPAMAELLPRLISQYFDEAELVAFSGQREVSQMFSQLPFDHLVFTGSTNTGRKVMAAASQNLVPVTLELGGKSPVIIGASADLPLAAERLAYGKTMHGGQICVTPDYVFLPKALKETFIDLYVKAVSAMYPKMVFGEDYSPIVNKKNYQRLLRLVQDAEEKGARIICVNPADENMNPDDSLKLPLHLVVDPSEDMTIMQEEIFGTVLAVKTYEQVDEALTYINDHDRPLSAYYFGADTAEQEKVITSITCGSMVINDFVHQIFHEQLPFGGVGASGMGRYRGEAGFRTFSNEKTVYYQTDLDEAVAPMRAPYGEGIKQFLAAQLGED